MRNFFLATTALAATLGATSAFAVDNGIYVGASVGEANTDFDKEGFSFELYTLEAVRPTEHLFTIDVKPERNNVDDLSIRQLVLNILFAVLECFVDVSLGNNRVSA